MRDVVFKGLDGLELLNIAQVSCPVCVDDCCRIPVADIVNGIARWRLASTTTRPAGAGCCGALTPFSTA